MVGSNHIKCALFTLAPIGALAYACKDIPSVQPFIQTYSQPYMLALFVPLYLLGTLLPDIDNPNATISKRVHFYVPVPHRTITHAIWIPIILLYFSFRLPLLLPIALGWIIHILYDTPSNAGVCWFWPYPGYVHYDSGAFVKKHHTFKLYKAGSNTEDTISNAICAINILLALTILVFVSHVNIPFLSPIMEELWSSSPMPQFLPY